MAPRARYADPVRPYAARRPARHTRRTTLHANAIRRLRRQMLNRTSFRRRSRRRWLRRASARGSLQVQACAQRVFRAQVSGRMRCTVGSYRHRCLTSMHLSWGFPMQPGGRGWRARHYQLAGQLQLMDGGGQGQDGCSRKVEMARDALWRGAGGSCRRC